MKMTRRKFVAIIVCFVYVQPIICISAFSTLRQYTTVTNNVHRIHEKQYSYRRAGAGAKDFRYNRQQKYPISYYTQLFSSNGDQQQDFFKGAPSTPGFKPGQFDKLSQWATSTASNRPIVAEYDPDGLWLWTQWTGTIREMTFSNVIFSLLWSIVVDLYTYHHYTVYLIAAAAVNGGDPGELIQNLSWVSFEIPHSTDPFIDTLNALNSLWEYQLQLTVFTLSFFVNHAYQYWRNVYFCTRAIQGRLNDLCMLVTMGARRSAKYGDINGTIGYQTNLQLHPDDNIVTEKNDSRDAKRLVSDVTRLLRMSHTFFWAATPTHSDGFGDVHHTQGGIVGDDDLNLQDFDPSQFGPILMSQDGLNMLVRRGQLTENEKQALIATGLPPSQYPFVLLEWAGIRCVDALESGELRGGPGFEENLFKYFTQCRAEYFSIGDFNSGRMPMAYVQFMEVLVDLLVILAPLALYTKQGTFNIFATVLITLFFKGLLELSKSFLDPFGREGYRAHNIRVDVLVSEMNFGASSRWTNAGDALPSDLLKPPNVEQHQAISTDQIPSPTIRKYQSEEEEDESFTDGMSQVASGGQSPRRDYGVNGKSDDSKPHRQDNESDGVLWL